MANYNLKGLIPVLENEKYALYALNQNNKIYQGVRLEKATGKQVEVAISLDPKPHVVALMLNGRMQKIY